MRNLKQGWFKPENDQAILFKHRIPQGLLRIRGLQLENDMDDIYDWVNQEYAKRFWQMNGSKTLLLNTYTQLLNNPVAHSFMVLLGEKKIAQVDLYLVSADELDSHVEAAENDCGVHLLMLPPGQMEKGWSTMVLNSFISFYFAFRKAGTLYAEPDEENDRANLLARRCGFQFLKKIKMSYKMANLYSITREQFNERSTG